MAPFDGPIQANEDRLAEEKKREDSMAERAGFEPAVPLGGTTAFEAAAFNHSATSP